MNDKKNPLDDVLQQIAEAAAATREEEKRANDEARQQQDRDATAWANLDRYLTGFIQPAVELVVEKLRAAKLNPTQAKTAEVISANITGTVNRVRAHIVLTFTHPKERRQASIAIGTYTERWAGFLLVCSDNGAPIGTAQRTYGCNARITSTELALLLDDPERAKDQAKNMIADALQRATTI